VAAREEGGRASRHDDEVSSLTAQISFLDEEIAVLRRRLADSPRQVRLLEERLRETEASLTSVTSQNERLASTLREARDQIVALKEEVDRLAQPPSGFGVFLAAREDNTADVFTGGRKMRVNVSPNVELEALRPGQEVVLNEALNIVIAQDYETIGEVVMLKEILADGERALVISHADEERVARLAEPVRQDARTYRGFNLFNADDLALFVALTRGEWQISGFRNASHDPEATLIAVVGGPDPGKVDWHPSVIDAARKTGLAVDDDGHLLVDQAAE